MLGRQIMRCLWDGNSEACEPGFPYLRINPDNRLIRSIMQSNPDRYIIKLGGRPLKKKRLKVAGKKSRAASSFMFML